MPATVGSETWNSIIEKGVKFEGAQLARKFAVGAWTKLRIGARVWISDVGTAPTGSIFLFGLCSGTVNLPGDASCQHFVGWRSTSTTGTKTTTFTRTTAANSYVQWNPAWSLFSKLVGTTHTDLSAGNSAAITFWGPTGSSVWRMSTFMIQFTRVSATQMTLESWSPGSFAGYGAIAAPSKAQFDGAMLAGDPTSVINGSGQLLANLTRSNQAVNESVDGALDTVVFGWDMAYPFLFLNDLAVARIA